MSSGNELSISRVDIVGLTFEGEHIEWMWKHEDRLISTHTCDLVRALGVSIACLLQDTSHIH